MLAEMHRRPRSRQPETTGFAHGEIRAVTSYSRIEFHTSEASAEPLAEVETPAGLKVRIFKVNAETVSLLSALSGLGRAL
jgi:hypothetical protein